MTIKSPTEKGYKWGYFQAAVIMICSIASALFSVWLLITSPEVNKLFMLYLFFGSILLMGLGFFVWDKDRGSFIIATILSLNPIIWIINYFYIKRRSYLKKSKY